MRQIFVFTAGVKIARSHLNDSVLNPVSFDRMRKHLGDERTDYFQELHPGQDGFYAWGAVPGEKNIPTWEEMQVGDLVLTVYDLTYHFVSTVTGKVHSPELAEDIWQRDKDGKTWEYMYFLSKPQKVSLSVTDPVIAGHLRSSYRGFCRIGTPSVQGILAKFGSLDNFVEQVFHRSLPKSVIERELEQVKAEADDVDEFDPQSLTDGRTKVLREMVRRQGQPKFRQLLINAYAGQCAVTGCRVESVLEAAHISPYLGKASNGVNNGLLLRADIHTLFDMGKLRISPEGVIQLHEDLQRSEYSVFEGKKIIQPSEPAHRPSPKSFQMKLDMLA